MADNQNVTTSQDTPVSITLTASDFEDGAPMFVDLTAPASGVLSGDMPNLTYTPNPGFVGEDSFTFTVMDSGGLTATGTIFITVEAAPTLQLPEPVLGEDALDATYFPFWGVDWASQVFVYEGVVSGLAISNDAPFIRFDLTLPDGNVVGVEGVPERADMPVVQQGVATPLPTPSLTPTVEGLVEPPVMSEGQISPVVNLWRETNAGFLEQFLNDGDTAAVLGVFDSGTGRLIASAVWKRMPDGSLAPAIYRSLLHENELRPELAPFYAGETVWVVTTIGNVAPLAQGLVDLTAFYDPGTPAIVRGRLAWDNAATLWLENVYVYLRQASREYVEVFRP